MLYSISQVGLNNSITFALGADFGKAVKARAVSTFFEGIWNVDGRTQSCERVFEELIKSVSTPRRLKATASVANKGSVNKTKVLEYTEHVPGWQ